MYSTNAYWIHQHLTGYSPCEHRSRPNKGPNYRSVSLSKSLHKLLTVKIIEGTQNSRLWRRYVSFICDQIWRTAKNSVPPLPDYRLATSWVHYTTSCNTQSSAPEDGRDQRPKNVELIGIINKPLLLHLVGVYIIYINDARSNKYQTPIYSQITLTATYIDPKES